MATAIKYCRKCGIENKKDAKFCKKCGTEFTVPKAGGTLKPAGEEKFICEYCGQLIEPGAIKCRYCDADVPENVRVKMSAASNAAKARPKAVPAEAPAKKQGAAKVAVQVDPRRANTAKQTQGYLAKLVKAAIVPKKSGKKLIALVTAAAVFIVTAFGYPGFLKNSNTPPEPLIGGKAVSYVENAVPIGKSEAIRLDVEKGVVVTAAENALYENTTLKVEPIESASDELMNLEEELRENGEYAFAAWEVDAGLAPDEFLPGEFKMEVDLAELELSEELYDNVCFYRYADDGSLLEYSTERDGSVITFTSNQNSIIISAVVIHDIILAVGSLYAGLQVNKYIAKRNAEKYYTTKPGESPCTLSGSSSGCDYTITFFASDVDPEFSKKSTRLKEIQKATIDAVEASMYEEQADFFKRLSYNKRKALRVDEMLSQNTEYKNILESFAAPKFMERFVPIVKDAYDYLACHVMVKMPKYCVDIYLKTGLKDLAYQVTKLVGNPYIEVNVTPGLVKSAEDGGEVWDNLLLTMTHELFHVCQANYHSTYFSDSMTFDEMTAVLLEADAFDYYKEAGKITTNPECLLESSAYLEMLYYPMDHVFTEEKKETNEVKNQQHGYGLARFADYLRKKLDSSVTAKELMEARSYAWKTNISDPLKYCFKLTDDTIDSYYKSFVMDHNGSYDNRELIVNAYEGGTKIPHRTVYIKSEIAKSIKTEFDGPLCLKYHDLLVKLEVPTAFLLVPEKNFEEACPGAVIIPSEEYQRTTKGIFMPAKEADSKSLRMILECMGTDYLKDSNSSFTVYPIREPAAPDLSEEDGKLYLKLPKADDVYKNGYAEGYRAVFSVNGEQRLTKLIKAKEFEDLVSVDLKEITGETEGTVSISVYYIPVLEDNESSPVGPKSPSSTIEVQIGETAPDTFDVSVLNGHWQSMETRFSYDITISGDEIIVVTYNDGERRGEARNTFTFDGKELSTTPVQVSQNCYIYTTFLVENKNLIRIGTGDVAIEPFTRIE